MLTSWLQRAWAGASRACSGGGASRKGCRSGSAVDARTVRELLSQALIPQCASISDASITHSPVTLSYSAAPPHVVVSGSRRPDECRCVGSSRSTEHRAPCHAASHWQRPCRQTPFSEQSEGVAHAGASAVRLPAGGSASSSSSSAGRSAGIVGPVAAFCMVDP